MTTNLKIQHRLSLVASLIAVLIFFITTSFKEKETKVRLTFINIANGKEIVLRDSVYQNAFGESYSISKLRYYISNIKFDNEQVADDQDNYQLIDLASGNTGFEIPVKENKYQELSFLVGVDSARNCSGAQEGALDPMKDMFWTWNTGYVMFKLEGTSPSSTSNRKRIEHHVGGYRFGNNVATRITLRFPSEVKFKNDINEIVIRMDMDKYWQGKNDVRISEDPVCTLPGALAKKIAGNFTGMFSLSDITEHTK